MTVKVAYYKKAVLVTGAFDVKDELKSLGGKYNIKLKGWVFSKKKRDAVISRLQSLQGVDLVDDTADTAAAASSTASASANAGGGVSSNARGGRSSANDDDYSDLASLLHLTKTSLQMVYQARVMYDHLQIFQVK